LSETAGEGGAAAEEVTVEGGVAAEGGE